MRVKKLTALLLTGALTVSALTGCGINKNATVATMTGAKVTLGVANFMCMYEQATADEIYRSYAGDDVWNTDLYGLGSTMAETVKDNVMDTLHEMYTLKAHMDDYDVEITDEEEAKIKQSAQDFISSNKSATLKELGATESIVEEVLTLYTIQSKTKEAILEKTEVTDEEANMRAYTMVTIDFSDGADEDDEDSDGVDDEDVDDADDEDTDDGSGVDDADADDGDDTDDADTDDGDDTDDTDTDDGSDADDADADDGDDTDDGSDVDEEEKAQLKETAEAIVKAVKEGTDLETAATDNGQTATTGTYDADDDELDEKVKEALDALKEGEVSDVIETDTSFVIVHLDKETDEEATEENREDIKEEKFNDLLAEWQEDDNWTVKQSQLDKIVFRNKFETTNNAESDADSDTEEDTEGAEETIDGTETDPK